MCLLSDRQPTQFSTATILQQLSFPHSRSVNSLEVLDLFTGLGGLAAGFRDTGFAVVGVDCEEIAEAVYKLDKLGDFRKADLSSDMVITHAPVIIGGPPCRPWSNVNQQKRKLEHEEHALLDRFFDHVAEMKPEVFLMENVLALKSDNLYKERVKDLRRAGYSVQARILRYSDYGAATSRKRLFTVGVKDSTAGADTFFQTLTTLAAPGETVRSAIFWARDLARDAIPDHDWSVLETIWKYDERYRTGRYGWMKLDYDKPAPSFGSIAKTYVLHPEAGKDGYPTRVLSVREAMSIMGFPRDFRFPDKTARAKRYLMVANAVSPIVSRACATTILTLLDAGSNAGGSRRNETVLVDHTHGTE